MIRRDYENKDSFCGFFIIKICSQGLLFTGNVPRGVFCERRSQKTRGAAVPAVLLLLRQALDFSYKEELVMTSLADYVEQVRTWVEEVPVPQKNDPVLQEEIVDKITRSIRQTAATGSHFSKMLSPEEEEIMKEIIREFMNAE